MSIYLQESIRIGDGLIKRLIVKEDYAYWENLRYEINFGGGGDFIWKESESLYGGNSGILLFIIALYKETGNNKYSLIIELVLNWLVRNSTKPTDNYSLYTGRLSTAFIFLKWYEHTKDINWLTAAENCTADAENFIKLGLVDLMLGLSGSILFFIQLYELSGKERYLQLIDLYAAELIGKSLIGAKAGIYWNRNEGQVRGLCGLSHGAAGIGLAFLEMGKYFGRDALSWLGNEAFNYEQVYFDPKMNNWPDFRHDAVRQEDELKREAAFTHDDGQYFYKSNFMNAWCHGAAGIGLARQRAYELFQNNSHRESYLSAMQHLNNPSSFASNFEKNTLALCHGFAGNADLHINHKQNTNPDYSLNAVYDLAKIIIQKRKAGHIYRSGFYKSDDEDVSLFMGNAGIGYFFLRLHNLNIPSALLFNAPARKRALPNLEAYPTLAKSKGQMLWDILRKRFPRTIKYLKEAGVFDAVSLFPPAGHSDYTTIEQLFCRQIEKLLETDWEQINKLRLEDIYLLEKKRVEVERQDASNAFLATIFKQAEKQLRSDFQFDVDQMELMNIMIQAHPYYRHQYCKFYWSGYHPDFAKPTIEQRGTHYVLTPSLNGVLEYPVSEIVIALLEGCQQRISYKHFLHEFLSRFDDLSSDDLKNARQLVLEKIKELHSLCLVMLIPQPVIAVSKSI